MKSDPKWHSPWGVAFAILELTRHEESSVAVPECIVRLGNQAIGFSLLNLRSAGYCRALDYDQSSGGEKRSRRVSELPALSSS